MDVDWVDLAFILHVNKVTHQRKANGALFIRSTDYSNASGSENPVKIQSNQDYTFPDRVVIRWHGLKLYDPIMQLGYGTS